ncbi:ChuX/HutX family heme-like substrate-binding protein [Marivita sp. GX14005]|uniref:hemin-degrading factor n=1 Tax=Marivita sp. GX14005 TaxID=2942276 RepID=UPI00201A06E9|nr:ChuX/HutX family heme-like substrate-binding protein [Marivita sp. GX14005]MCL3883377.1 hemin-degrading factor [Marivita sp. GX14005]
MALDNTPTPSEIRATRSENPKARERDLADTLGISEAQLIAAHVGQGATRLKDHPDGIIGAAGTFGEVMALTRNASCVSEVVGQYANYHPGPHAAMVLNEPIDLRIFPKHWQHAYAVEKPIEGGVRRSLQVFDAAGDAIHKIFLRDGSDDAAFARAVDGLRHEDQSDALHVVDRAAPEPAKSNPAKLDALCDGWSKMTDTHQFFAMAGRLKMNRLGAYRIVGAPFVRRLTTEAVDRMLRDVQGAGIPIMIFVGNKGCIQIFSGPLKTLKAMGPWQNVLDPGFDMHLRLDHIAEVYAVDKPTKRGAAISVEAFDAEGSLIFQIFPVPAGRDLPDSRAAWKSIVDALPGAESTEAA